MEINDRFGRFTILNVDKKNTTVVRCDCGEETTRRQADLVSGRTVECKRCSARRTAKVHGTPNRSEYVGDLGKTYFSTLRYGAVKRGLAFTISQQYAWDTFMEQGAKCALSGVPINLSTAIYNSAPDYTAFTASLDRIDSSRGYVEGNVQWLHKDVNRLKNNLSQTEFINWCLLIAKYANQQPSLGNDTVSTQEGSETRQ